MRALCLSVLCLCACEGRISAFIDGTPVGPTAVPNPCSTVVTVGTAPMRRLSHDEYRNSLSDLQPGWASLVSTESRAFTQDSESLGFKNSATFLDVKPVLAQQYMDTAEKVAAQAVLNLPALLPCDPAGNEAGCADQFISTMGRRLYRHRLSTEELARYTTVYAAARAQGYDFKTGIEWLVFAFLNSPGFLYRVELDPAGASGVRPLTGPELASRLSYLLWQSAPDETLLAASEAGGLSTRADLDAQARRMLEDPKARRLTDFFDQWLKWEGLETLQRDASSYPGLAANLGPLLHVEARTFAEKTVFDGDHTLSSLLTGQYSFVNQALAQHYGLSGITGSAFQRVSLPNRGGLMMLGGTLAARDLNTRTSIVHRGLAIRTTLMCQAIPAPPANIPALGPIDASLSQAQRLEQHRQSPSCSGCHNRIDSLGTPFEGFDAVGRARTVDGAGHVVETTGELTASRDSALNGPVSSPMELMQKLGQSSEVRDCFATQLYRFSSGRKEETADQCSQYTLQKSFEASGGDVKSLLLSLTQVDDFNYRQVQP